MKGIQLNMLCTSYYTTSKVTLISPELKVKTSEKSKVVQLVQEDELVFPKCIMRMSDIIHCEY